MEDITSALNRRSPQNRSQSNVHIPWEHNTDIVPDLIRLVKVTDERIQLGKRPNPLSMRCEQISDPGCGLCSLQKSYVMSVQEAYDDVKKLKQVDRAQYELDHAAARVPIDFAKASEQVCGNASWG